MATVNSIKVVGNVATITLNVNPKEGTMSGSGKSLSLAHLNGTETVSGQDVVFNVQAYVKLKAAKAKASAKPKLTLEQARKLAAAE